MATKMSNGSVHVGDIKAYMVTADVAILRTNPLLILYVVFK